MVVRPGVASCTAPPTPPPKPVSPNGRVDPDWAAAYNEGSLLYSATLAPLMPYVGNGHIATHPVHSNAAMRGVMYAAGVFNGIAVPAPCDGTFCNHPVRAAIPTYNVQLDYQTAAFAAGATPPTQAGGGVQSAVTRVRYALDLLNGVLLRRAELQHGARFEERWYAHATRKELLVHEAHVDNTAPLATNPTAVTVNFTVVVGAASADIDFTTTTTGTTVTSSGKVNHMELPTLPHTEVALASNAPPGTPVVVGGGTQRSFLFITSVSTSLDAANSTLSLQLPRRARAAPPGAVADAAAAALQAGLAAGAPALLQEHSAAWQDRWSAGRIEVGGNLGLAQAVNASLYFLLSSTRADVPLGVSPGGLASNGYQGHTFWDQE